MINMYGNKIYGLIGAVRSGKDSIANFLTETRGFKQMAFADQIKEEFGISKEDFEAAKIAGNIEELREKLWEFSAAKREKNPFYFIRKVIDKATSHEGSVIITDIRTEDEIYAFFKMVSGSSQRLKRVYWVRGNFESEFDSKGQINGSKLHEKKVTNYLMNPDFDLKCVWNYANGLYAFHQYLDKFFFTEDIEDLWNNPMLKERIKVYLEQFEIKMKESGKS